MTRMHRAHAQGDHPTRRHSTSAEAATRVASRAELQGLRAQSREESATAPREQNGPTRRRVARRAQPSTAAESPAQRRPVPPTPTTATAATTALKADPLPPPLATMPTPKPRAPRPLAATRLQSQQPSLIRRSKGRTGAAMVVAAIAMLGLGNLTGWLLLAAPPHQASGPAARSTTAAEAPAPPASVADDRDAQAPAQVQAPAPPVPARQETPLDSTAPIPVASAVAALARGDYQAAHAAYASLASQRSDEPVYARIAEILKRRNERSCDSSSPVPDCEEATP
ncbi:MAG: hypothetical protein OEZ06_02435 [Myxococcales bacterium]|nr:hypothetical protein [Myxococcales bacterium]